MVRYAILCVYIGKPQLQLIRNTYERPRTASQKSSCHLRAAVNCQVADGGPGR